MLHKDRIYPRDKNLFQKHPELQQSMRAILLDWLMEVSEVYKLHRETFYLAQDFFDRFMAIQENVVKSSLQLIGITSLFIAAKLEVGTAVPLFQASLNGGLQSGSGLSQCPIRRRSIPPPPPLLLLAVASLQR
ncbi:hypothetical protein AB205_0045680 [Aquarana catesbeiana]|uniref:Cyclin-like domain-containing protein n=1 Tax=Aquarana catesbeiana TaxID=8400 RepID=A0A2G9RZA0_AQUCT|nr:hypothetical protein AB205_0045680 [Aquarana catesbeiana]